MGTLGKVIRNKLKINKNIAKQSRVPNKGKSYVFSMLHSVDSSDLKKKKKKNSIMGVYLNLGIHNMRR